jgi:predicted GNAT superfamily acetyltransferase
MPQTDTSIGIREIDSFEEMNACVQLQQAVWKFPDLDVIPRRMLIVAREVGGHILGAWSGNRLAGFSLAIPGVRGGKSYWHSHMLAVAPEYRNRGIGAQLKWAQRTSALARGIEKIEWTFDPLQTKNAHLNIEKLGAVARRYTPDFYGTSTSALQGSRPTDRLHAEWELRSKRVEGIVAGRALPDAAVEKTIAILDAGAVNGASDGLSRASTELLLRVREEFAAAFARGLTVLRFDGGEDGRGRYLLGVEDDSCAAQAKRPLQEATR